MSLDVSTLLWHELTDAPRGESDKKEVGGGLCTKIGSNKILHKNQAVCTKIKEGTATQIPPCKILCIAEKHTPP
jgi:hypothetical protein